MGLDYFYRFVGYVSEWNPNIHVAYALQTNATLLDDEWCEFLAKYQFLVGVSFDLLPDRHNVARVDHNGKGTYKQVRHSISLLEKYGVEYNVLCTLTNQIARFPKQVWNQIVKLDLQYVQFTPCLDELEKPGESIYALTQERFASFYTGLFPLWYADYCKGKYRSVKLFDDIVNLMAFGIPTSCGLNGYCQPQLVVEADGSVYPCDFYCLDEYCMGNITEMTISQLRESSQQGTFLDRQHNMPKLCSDCVYRRFCSGNCKRMQREICCSGEDNFCGYKTFLDACGGILQNIAMCERKARGQT